MIKNFANKIIGLSMSLIIVLGIFNIPVNAAHEKLLYKFDPTAPLTNDYDPWWANNATVVGDSIVTTGSNAILGFYCGRDYLAARNGVYEFQADINSDLADMTLVSVVACTDSAEAELVRLYREGNNRHVMNLGQWQGGIGTNTATGVRAKARWDTSTKQITVTLTALLNNYTFPSRSYTIAGQYIDRIEFRCATRKISNITFKQIVDIPSVDESSVVLKTAGGDVQSMTEASPKTKTVEFSFDEAMNEETLTEENIYITDASSNRVSYTGSYAGCVYKMTLDKKLKASTNYTLHISGDVTSVKGEKMGSDTEIVFTTGTDVEETKIINANELPYFEDFDSDAPLNNDVHPWKHWGGITVADGHVVKSSNMNLFFSTSSLGATTTGKYIFECEMSAPSSAQGSYAYPVIFLMANINGTDTILAKIYTEGSNWHVTKFNTWAGGISAGSALKFKMTWDADNGICSVNLTAANDYNFGASSINFTPGTAMPSITFSGSTESYIDNVKLSLQREDMSLSDFDEKAIILSAENGTVQENWNELSPMTEKAEIAFGVPMNVKTMSRENIYIINGDDEKISGSSIYDDITCKWTMIFDDLLVPGVTYVMHIDGSIEDRSGYALGVDYDIPFGVSNDMLEANIDSITLNGAEVEEFARFKTGKAVDINLSYINTTGVSEGYFIIISYYGNNNKLVGCDLIKISDKRAKTGKLSIPYTPQVYSAASLARISVINSMKDCMLLGESVEIR